MKTLKKSLALTFASTFMFANIALAAPYCKATVECANGTTISCIGEDTCMAGPSSVTCITGDTASSASCDTSGGGVE